MLTKAVEQFSGKAAEDWASTVFTPAFLFWTGGLAAWLSHQGWSPGTQRLTAFWNALPNDAAGVAILVALLIAVKASGQMVERLQGSTLRLLEGYAHPAWLRSRILQARRAKEDQLETRWQQLRGVPHRNRGEETELVTLEARLHRLPAHPDHRLPTRLGNILRASERRSHAKYGLDIAVCWPRLWLLLPKEAQDDLSASRARLDEGARVWLWSVLFITWAVWAWWAALLGAASAFIAYRQALAAAEIYGDLLESAFDVHRMTLYQSVRWPMPATAADECACGERLTEYFLRGSDSSALRFES